MPELIFAYIPIVLLVYLMGKSDSMSASKALPLIAMLVYFIMLIVYQHDANLVHATVVKGLLLALTPVCIIAGAIFLFRCMETSGALNVIRTGLNHVSTNPIAQLMIIGWAFAFLIEGASGFGTPAAIAAPILFSLGFPAIRVAIACLIFNTVPVTFGAVGTPIWFGLSVISLSPAELAEIAWQAALVNTIAAPFVVVAGLALVVSSRKLIWQNLTFILLSTFSCTLPYLLLSKFSTEFPSLLGGLIGLVCSIVLAKHNIGLQKNTPKDPESAQAITPATVLKATFPLWATVLMLIATRVQELGIKPLLLSNEPAWAFSLGQLGELKISASLVVSLNHIFQTPQSWQHSILYVPSLLPFVVIALATLWLHRQGSAKEALVHTKQKMAGPFFALLGALVFVQLMMLGDSASAVNQIGNHLARLTGANWEFFAPFLGALGTFFSGSATISNLTFAGIQQSISAQLELSLVAILAMQSVGAAMGNMVCINNIVAVNSILGLEKQEGYILKRTVLVLLLYGTVAGTASVLLLAPQHG
ncbi:L-lactate permease [Alteromonas aestuariivivens]|uniref:L-lactate permease n=1 Tax=Alteromonas aestuariivivens TaxID=1938339 RepID=A0A3D8M440_9ALTE|nr:L-lactate permease [Alteromonas aestuariivivens]RDV24517.1 L-lactate permease [Alteromonas aestuariivivens]